MDAPPTDFGESPMGEVRPPPAPAPRKNGFAFFALVLGLYGVLGTTAQAMSPLLGLLWSQAFALLLPAFVAASGSNLLPARALLLARRPGVRAAALAPLIGAAAFVGAGALMQLTSILLPTRWLEIFDVSRLFDRPPLERVALSVAAATMAPFCEEVTFRGWLLTALRTRHSTIVAIALSGLLFAVMHLDPVRFSALVALGVLYAWLAWRSGSVWPSIVAHATNNGIGLLLTAVGAPVTSLQALPSSREVALGATMTLALSGVVLTLLGMAYRRATPAPPSLEDSLARADAADPSTSFRFGRVTGGELAAMAAATLSLAALAMFSAVRHR